MDITNQYLEAAVMDQVVAGLFNDRLYCFVAVLDQSGWALGVAVANERGYHPVAGKTFGDDKANADRWAKGLNQHIGHTDEEAARIVISTMGGRPVDTRLPCPRCGLLSGHRFPCTNGG